MKEIRLSKGEVAFVDDEDFEYLNQFKWFLSGRYVRRTVRLPDNSRTQLSMHHELFPNAVKRKVFVDHIDRNPLNNQKLNLRYCTTQQNCLNKGFRSKLGTRGVAFYPQHKTPYKATIYINGRPKHLGYFLTKELAAEAYNAACKETPDLEFRLLNPTP